MKVRYTLAQLQTHSNPVITLIPETCMYTKLIIATLCQVWLYSDDIVPVQ